MSDDLVDTQRDLAALREYVAAKMDRCGNHDLAAKVRGIRAAHDPAHDRKNRENPRAFCYVQERDWTIHCAYALERAAPPLRVGVLLHEIGHLVLNAFKEGEESEVDVDGWVLDIFPESGYTYVDGSYFAPHNQRFTVAKNVQHVSPEFVLRINDGFLRGG